jgi:hypothetical protein
LHLVEGLCQVDRGREGGQEACDASVSIVTSYCEDAG